LKEIFNSSHYSTDKTMDERSMSPESSQNTPTSSEMDDKHSFVTPDSEGFISGLIKEPLENDVLCGRGGSINSHGGNERFRLLVEKRKRVYLTARFKREKRLIASSIVTEIRDLNPPGRFLTRDSKSGHWQDIGDEKARDKTSQALRENAPTIRAEIETEINEQRAEMQRAEEEDVARATAQQPHPSYYNAGWGYPSSYYGYSHHAPPPPPPPPHGHPPHPGHPAYHNGPYGPPHAQWGGPPPPQYPGYDPHYPHPPHPQEAKSVFDNAADLVSSGAESIKNWTKHSLTFGGLHSTSSRDSHDARSVASSKPISYVHQPDAKKRRMVKFQDDAPQGRRRMANQGSRPPSSGAASVHSSNSLIDGADIEPHSLESTDAHNDSLMNQVANQLLVSFGSWDTSTFCGNNDSDDRVPFPNSGSAPAAAAEEEEEEMAVEWEGQEVQLTKDLDYNSVGSDERMPPPQLRQRQAPDHASSVGFSSLGSCHSWLPEQIGGAVSYFGGSTASMDMDYNSAGGGNLSTGGGTEQFSTGGSLGGGSLTRVFEHETLPDDMPSAMTPNMSHRNLSQIPSWERSVRSRSPLSIGSDDDDESLVSKAESVLSKGSATSSLSGLRGAPTSPTHMGTDDMAWESRE
jgi:hypothetical protein